MPVDHPPVPAPRIATPAEADVVVSLLVSAFHDDPVWRWAFPDPALRAEQHRRLWGLFVAGALRYPWVWLTPGDTATALWIPPHGTEFSTEQEAALEPLLQELLGTGADRVLQVFELFDEAHPHDVPHYFLDLLGTHVDHRGQGLGLGLLAHTLARIDEEGMPAYLEASNPGNVSLYRRYGFSPIGSFRVPDDGPQVVTMWREARAPG